MKIKLGDTTEMLPVGIISKEGGLCRVYEILENGKHTDKYVVGRPVELMSLDHATETIAKVFVECEKYLMDRLTILQDIF